MAERFAGALKRYIASGYKPTEAMKAVWQDVRTGRVARPARRRGPKRDRVWTPARVAHRQSAYRAFTRNRGSSPRDNTLAALASFAPPSITARAAGQLVRADPAVRRLPRRGYCVRLSDGRELCHDARGYYLVGTARNPLTRKETGQALVAVRELAKMARRVPSATAPERADPVAFAAHRGWWYGKADAWADAVRAFGTKKRGGVPRARKVYFGPRAALRNPRTNPAWWTNPMSKKDFVAMAEQLHDLALREGQATALTAARALVPALKASNARFDEQRFLDYVVSGGRRRNPWATYAGGTGAHHGHSYDIRGAAGEYHVWPPSTRRGGYSLMWANTRGLAAPHSGLWHDLGTFRSPQAAKSAAKRHAAERGVQLNPVFVEWTTHDPEQRRRALWSKRITPRNLLSAARFIQQRHREGETPAKWYVTGKLPTGGTRGNPPRFKVGDRVALADPVRVATRFWSAQHRGIIGAGGTILPRAILDRPAAVASVGAGQGGIKRVLLDWGIDDQNRSLGIWLDSDQLARANPGRRLVAPRAFDPRSFRTIRRGKARLTIGCPRGQWDAHRQRCKVGTRAQRILGNAGRARLTPFYDAISEIRGVKGRRFGFPRGTRFKHPFAKGRPRALGVDQGGLARVRRGDVLLRGRRPIYAQL